MKIKPFGVEQWMDLYETTCTYNIAETCVDSLTLRELEDLIGCNNYFADTLLDKRLTYGTYPEAKTLERVFLAYLNLST